VVIKSVIEISGFFNEITLSRWDSAQLGARLEGGEA
jgi:hypothetical protein